jgi:hypothetical protein
LVDLAAVLLLDDLARACHEAGVRYRTTPRQVDAVLARHPRGMRGAGNLRRVLHGDAPVVLSELERLFLELQSFRFHNSRRSWDQDHRRPRVARRRGDRFRSYTWTDVVEDPRDMLRELRELLLPTCPA